MRNIDTIIVHCAATRPRWGEGQPVEWKRDQIDAWHRDRGWNGIGYHYVIDRDGATATGRPVEAVGAHVKGHNAGSIGICLIGGHGSAATDAFADNYTPEQDAALRALIDDLKGRFPSITKVAGHNDFTTAKACPGFKVGEWLAGKPRSAARSTTVQASAVQVASGAGAAIGAVGALDGTAQIVALVFAGVIVLAALWIMRERLRRWADGVR